MCVFLPPTLGSRGACWDSQVSARRAVCCSPGRRHFFHPQVILWSSLASTVFSAARRPKSSPAHLQAAVLLLVDSTPCSRAYWPRPAATRSSGTVIGRCACFTSGPFRLHRKIPTLLCTEGARRARPSFRNISAIDYY